VAPRDTPEFTPAQVLDAARRAESEGRTEFAVQFYRHLATSFPGTPEAAAAEAGLSHLSPFPELTGRQRQTGLPPVNGYRLPDPFQAAPGRDPYDAPHQQYGGPQPQFATPATHGEHATPAELNHTTVDLPHPVSDYRTGRILARLVTWLGGLVILGGIALAVAAIAIPRTASSLPVLGSFVTGPEFGIFMAVGGLAQIILGQLVRALFDQANAARDLAIVTRARLEGRPAQHRRRSRR
jgi:hypothetical protein